MLKTGSRWRNRKDSKYMLIISEYEGCGNYTLELINPFGGHNFYRNVPEHTVKDNWYLLDTVEDDSLVKSILWGQENAP